jgi:hypothetical protein
MRFANIFYCLRFETFLFVTSYDSQGYGGGIQPCLHMGARQHQHKIGYINQTQHEPSVGVKTNIKKTLKKLP